MTELKPEQIEVGQRIVVEMPGVPMWKIPAQTMTVKITPENREAIIEDATERITMGAKVYLGS